MIKIDKGIPVPGYGNVSNKKYPFDKMKKGDSFYVKFPKKNWRNVRSRVQAAATAAKKRGSGEFVTKSYKTGIRCWKIK